MVTSIVLHVCERGVKSGSRDAVDPDVTLWRVMARGIRGEEGRLEVEEGGRDEGTRDPSLCRSL